MKIAINADAYSLTSELTVEAIKLLAENKSPSLKIIDKDGNEKFAIGYNEGKPSITTFGLTFGGTSHDGNGYATLTGMIPEDKRNNPKEYVAKLVAPVKAYVETIEAVAKTAAVDAKTQHEALLASITMN